MCKQIALTRAAIRNGASETDAQDAAAMVLIDPMSKADELIEKSEFDTLQSDLGQFGKITSSIQNLEAGFIPVGRYLMAFATAPTNEVLLDFRNDPIFSMQYYQVVEIHAAICWEKWRKKNGNGFRSVHCWRLCNV